MYFAQCNLHSKSIRRELIYVIKTKHEIAKSLQAAGIFPSERYRFGAYAKDIAFAIFREIGPASLLLRRKKLHVTLDG